MPTYQYRCDKCRATFTRTETISGHQKAKPRCPKCGGRKVCQVPGRFFAVTSKKS